MLSVTGLVNEAIENHAAQLPWELGKLLTSFSWPIERVLEIGTWEGGMAYLWAQVARHVITVDWRQKAPTLPANVRRIVGNSHDPATCAQIGRSPIDIVFIDGDHSYRGVKKDWGFYAPLARRMVILHDIMGTQDENFGVKRFWAELCRRYPGRLEVIVQDPTQTEAGYGIVHVGARW